MPRLAIWRSRGRPFWSSEGGSCWLPERRLEIAHDGSDAPGERAVGVDDPCYLGSVLVVEVDEAGPVLTHQQLVPEASEQVEV